MNFEVIQGDTADGFAQSIQEIDLDLSRLIPDLKRRACTPRVMAEADNLLDQRNEIIAIASCFAIEQEII